MDEQQSAIDETRSSSPSQVYGNGQASLVPLSMMWNCLLTYPGRRSKNRRKQELMNKNLPSP